MARTSTARKTTSKKTKAVKPAKAKAAPTTNKWLLFLQKYKLKHPEITNPIERTKLAKVEYHKQK